MKKKNLKNKRLANRLFTCGCIFIMLFAPVKISFAHPHSWIDLQSKFNISEDKMLRSIDFSWKFDITTSLLALNGAKSDDKQALKKLKKELLKNIAGEKYFSEFKLVDKSKNGGSGTQDISINFKVAKSELIFNKQLILNFTLELIKPINLHNKELKMQTYDKTYYVNMGYFNEGDLEINNSQCNLKLIAPNPSAVVIEEAAAIPQGINVEFNLGKEFAQTLSLSCN